MILVLEVVFSLAINGNPFQAFARLFFLFFPSRIRGLIWLTTHLRRPNEIAIEWLALIAAIVFWVCLIYCLFIWAVKIRRLSAPPKMSHMREQLQPQNSLPQVANEKIRACQKCGADVAIDAEFCAKCGAELPKMTVEDLAVAVAQMQKTQTVSARLGSDTAPSFGYTVLGFLVPAAGLILYLVWKDDKPGPATSAGKGALVSVIAGVALTIIYFIVIAVILGSAFG